MYTLFKIIFLLLASVNYLYCMFVFYKLYGFFYPSHAPIISPENIPKIEIIERLGDIKILSASLIQNMCLVILFILSHSFLKSIKSVYEKIGFKFFERSIYIFFTSLTLHVKKNINPFLYFI